MKTTTNNAPPHGNYTIKLLMEIASKYPTLLLEPLLDARIHLQSLFPSPCPIAIKLRPDEPDPELPSNVLSIPPWLANDGAAHGFLARDHDALKVVFPDKHGTLTITSVAAMTNSHAAHPTRFSPTEWWDLDLYEPVYDGRPVVTIYEPGHAAPSEWVAAMNHIFAELRGNYWRQMDSVNGMRGEIKLTSPEFHEELRGLPSKFRQGMLTLADEIVRLLDFIIHETVDVGHDQCEMNMFEAWCRTSTACIAAMAPGLRSLTFHGLGWPVPMNPIEAKALLLKIRREQPVSLSRISRFRKALKADSRDHLLSYLLDAGVASMEGRLISTVEPVQFFEDQLRKAANKEKFSTTISYCG